MTELRLVALDTSLDSAGRQRKRDSVLRAYRLTPAALESTASRIAARPEHATQLLHAIDARVATANRPKPVAAPAAPVLPPPRPLAPNGKAAPGHL